MKEICSRKTISNHIEDTGASVSNLDNLNSIETGNTL